ncbi:MAG: rhomboid family intramembrane serine protease [Cloacibacterium sp.]|nr:rhomboid family intramembrane serine protease [Cloacibacterium sp.]
MINNIVSYRALFVPASMLFAMWLGFALQQLGIFDGCFGAIIPLVPDGLKGVLLSPLLHGNLEHIISNSLPISVLLFLLYQFYSNIANQVFFWGWLFSGLAVWLLPPMNFFGEESVYTCIIGASGLVYMLAFFLFFSGVFRWNMKLLTIALLVALYYGSMIWGIFPEEFFTELNEPSRISWQSHLSGAVVGTFLAFFHRNKGETRKKFIWEYPNYYSEKDDKLWQEYRETHAEDFDEMPQLQRDNVWKYLDELRKKD